MKSMIRYLTLVVVAGSLTLAPSAFAGECCKKAAKKAEAGKSCSGCAKHQCCKDAVAKVEKDGKAKTCANCSAKKEEKKS